MEMKKKVGRPKLPLDQRQKYQRIAVYPQTYDKLKAAAENNNVQLIDLIEAMAKNLTIS